MINHYSNEIPTFPEYWDAGDNEWIWIGWSEVLEGASIVTSAWTLPDGWTEHATQENQTVEDEDGTSHTNCNGVRTSNTNAPEGVVEIKNRIALSDSRTYERTVRLRVMVQ